jgi:hypothetical protein
MRLAIETGAPTMRPHFLYRLPGAQRGQSMIEFTILCAVFVVALFVPIPGQQPPVTAGQMLADRLRDFYSALSYFLSLP